jgi:hypothetical protein
MEILDPTEARYYFGGPDAECWACQMHELRRRVPEMKDWPPFEDHWRLPTKEAAQAAVTLNHGYQRHLKEEWNFTGDPTGEVRQALRETEELWQVWDAVRDATSPYYYTTVRRRAMAKLKGLVGDEAYRRMDLPPPVPVWRFGEIRP